VKEAAVAETPKREPEKVEEVAPPPKVDVVRSVPAKVEPEPESEPEAAPAPAAEASPEKPNLPDVTLVGEPKEEKEKEEVSVATLKKHVLPSY
jgi:hypothetical protein